MHCYICDGPSVGMCRQCDRYYCSTHAGRRERASCKVCAIGAQPDENHSREASELVTEIVDASKPASPFSEAVLSQEQAARLLDILLSMLTNSGNESVRIQVAHSLRRLAEYSRATPGSLVREWPLYKVARKSLSTLLTALDDEEYWVRFAVAETLIGAKCREGIRPIVKLWLEKDIDAFPSNIMQHLEALAEYDKNAQGELQKVLVDLHATGSGLMIGREREPDQADQ